ncbi:hypothetical protein PPBDW_I20293 [Photobacterium kishitanii]|nr:hypothetical protein PPBDW_I20293 [Photobacterium kishitanii]
MCDKLNAFLFDGLNNIGFISHLAPRTSHLAPRTSHVIKNGILRFITGYDK